MQVAVWDCLPQQPGCKGFGVGVLLAAPCLAEKPGFGILPLYLQPCSIRVSHTVPLQSPTSLPLAKFGYTFWRS